MLKNPNDTIKFDENHIKTIYLAGGCFWGTEGYMKRILGVYKTKVGYANGHTENPTYEAVCSKKTGFAETVKVEYDTTKISLEEVLTEFFKTINPTQIDRQGGDIGNQYRSGIYYVDEEDKEIADQFIINAQKNYKDSIATEVEKLINFYDAEEYHQDYLDKNPSGYCHVDLSRFI